LQIDVIIPTYNEAENLPKLVSALFSLPLDLRVLIVDDNSPDGTGRVADRLAAEDSRVHVIHRDGKLGLRSAYITGIHNALEDDAEAVLQMDADFSHDPARIPAMVEQLAQYDMVLGSRYVRGGSVDVKWAAWRKGLSAFANFYARTILGMRLHDVTTGFRLWRRETLLGMPLEQIRSNGYVFLVEMVYLAYCLEYRIGEVPIYFADRKLGESKMSVRIQIEAAFRVWQVWWGNRRLRRLGRRARLARSRYAPG
jgi:dolichol-phosphate mannosyltransferase